MLELSPFSRVLGGARAPELSADFSLPCRTPRREPRGLKKFRAQLARSSLEPFQPEDEPRSGVGGWDPRLRFRPGRRPRRWRSTTLWSKSSNWTFGREAGASKPSCACHCCGVKVCSEGNEWMALLLSPSFRAQCTNLCRSSSGMVSKLSATMSTSTCRLRDAPEDLSRSSIYGHAVYTDKSFFW